MTDPRHRGNHAATGRGIAVDEIEIGGHARYRNLRRRRQAIANPAQLPAQNIAERFGDRPDVVVAESSRRVMGFRHRAYFNESRRNFSSNARLVRATCDFF
jgi:hypothetical protein